MKKLVFVLLASAVYISAQEKGLSPEFSSMVSTERAFARMAGTHGVRDSFITFFADDGVNFTPHPVKTRENLMATPPPKSLPPIVLNWTPVYGDIAASSDLGYNTGPFVVEDKSPEKRPTRHGMFFSIWRKQSDGAWKVVLDMGISTPSSVAPLNAPFVAAPVAKIKVGSPQPSSEGQAQILKLERDFLSAASGKSLAAGLGDSLSETARFYSIGKMPLTGRKAILDGLVEEKRSHSAEPIDGGMSGAADFGYVYGRYQLQGTDGAIEKGYYTRVWRLDGSGKWRIAMYVVNPLPAGAK